MSNYQPTNPIWRHGFSTALNINTQFDAGNKTGQNLNLSEYMVNGSILGWNTIFYSTKKTYCSTYFKESESSSGTKAYWVPFKDIEQILYNAFTQITSRYSVRKLSLEYLPGSSSIRGLGIALEIGYGAEIWIYKKVQSEENMDWMWNISYLLSFEMSLVIDGKIMNSSTFSISVGSTENDGVTTKRLEISLTYYDLPNNGYIWCDGDILIFPLQNDVILFSSYFYYLKDSSQTYTLHDTESIISTSTSYPTVIAFPTYATDSTLKNISKIKRAYIKGDEDGTIMYLDKVGQTLLKNGTASAAAITLFNNDAKYFYVRWYGGLVIVIDPGTL